MVGCKMKKIRYTKTWLRKFPWSIVVDKGMPSGKSDDFKYSKYTLNGITYFLDWNTKKIVNSYETNSEYRSFKIGEDVDYRNHEARHMYSNCRIIDIEKDSPTPFRLSNGNSKFWAHTEHLVKHIVLKSK
jgi:hypothetical protein